MTSVLTPTGEANHDLDLRVRLGDFDDVPRGLEVDGDGLLDQNVLPISTRPRRMVPGPRQYRPLHDSTAVPPISTHLARLDGGDSIRRMGGRRRRDQHSLTVALLQTRLYILVQLDSFWEPLLGGVQDRLNGVDQGDELSPGSEERDISGVTGAHPASAEDGELELAFGGVGGHGA